MQESTPPRGRARPSQRLIEQIEEQLEAAPARQPDAGGDLRVLLINGPNLNMLGSRQPEIYGSMTLAEIEEHVRQRAAEMEVEVRCFQSNNEGEIIDFIQAEGPSATGIIINPGALTHYSLALRDTIEAVDKPTIEVHISNIHQREEFRRRTVTGEMADAVIAGFGWHGYLIALDAMFSVPVTRKPRK
jgi:3-dehydroquinate dehydratase-2